MTRKVKLFIVDEKPYLVSLEQIGVGDNVIVTVGGQYPSVVKCENEQILELITNSKLTLTKPFKIVVEPEKITLNEDQINKLTEGDGVLEIVEENGVITYNL